MTTIHAPHPTTNHDSHNAENRDFAHMIDEHRPALMRYVLRLTFGDAHLAEDLVQETLLRMWQRADSLVDASLRPWLFTVARNLVCDHHRARKARPAEVYDTAVDHKPAMVDDIDNALTAHDMKYALAQLSEEHRKVLIEVYYRGQQLTETATTLGIPVGTVKSRLYYALRSLRHIINNLNATTDTPRAA